MRTGEPVSETAEPDLQQLAPLARSAPDHPSACVQPSTGDAIVQCRRSGCVCVLRVHFSGTSIAMTVRPSQEPPCPPTKPSPVAPSVCRAVHADRSALLGQADRRRRRHRPTCGRRGRRWRIQGRRPATPARWPAARRRSPPAPGRRRPSAGRACAPARRTRPGRTSVGPRAWRGEVWWKRVSWSPEDINSKEALHGTVAGQRRGARVRDEGHR